MKKFFCMQPRQSGKSAKAYYEYLKDPDNSIIIFKSNNRIKDFCSKFDIASTSNNFVSIETFLNMPIYKNIKTIILDEYMFFHKKYEIYKKVHEYSNVENVYIFSTSDKKYNKLAIDFVKKYKESGYNITNPPLADIYDNIGRNMFLPKNLKVEIGELYYNFLTDANTVVIDKNIKSIYPKRTECLCLDNIKNDIEILNTYTY